jgi:tetratricopeptide (TPR) repeat protein
MNRLVLSLILFPTIALISCGSKNEPLPEKIDFQTDFAAARKTAADENKPMIIDFYTDWCKWCKVLDTVTYVDPLVIGMSVDNIFVKVDAEADTALAREYGIAGYPTVVVAGPDGKEMDRIWGYLPPTDFYNQVQLYLQGKETLEDYLGRLEDEPENLDYLSLIAEKFASRSRFDEAIEYYLKIVALDPDNERDHGADAMAAIYDTQGRAGDYEGAIATCRKVVEKFPGTSEADDAAAMIGYYTARNGENGEALKLYREYLEKHPDSENAEWVKRRVADLEDNI